MSNVSTQTTEPREQAILVAALAVFARYGFRRATMADLAAEAGLSRPLLYLSYPNKASVFAAAARAFAGRLCTAAEQAWDPGMPAREGLEAAALALHLDMHALLKASPHGRELLATDTGLVADVMQEMDRRFVELVTNRLTPLLGRGEAALRAETVSAALHGIKDTAPDAATLRRRIGCLAALATVHRAPDISPQGAASV